jgi:hypothetical protein
MKKDTSESFRGSRIYFSSVISSIQFKLLHQVHYEKPTSYSLTSQGKQRVLIKKILL